MITVAIGTFAAVWWWVLYFYLWHGRKGRAVTWPHFIIPSLSIALTAWIFSFR